MASPNILQDLPDRNTADLLTALLAQGRRQEAAQDLGLLGEHEALRRRGRTAGNRARGGAERGRAGYGGALRELGAGGAAGAAGVGGAAAGRACAARLPSWLPRHRRAADYGTQSSAGDRRRRPDDLRERRIRRQTCLRSCRSG